MLNMHVLVNTVVRVALEFKEYCTYVLLMEN